MLLLETWRNFERATGNASAVETITTKMPKRVKKKRPIIAEDGTQTGLEEYYDYLFPDEQVAQPALKILEMAQKWKRQKAEQPTVEDENQ